jgi:hypothetical protein
LGKREVDRKEVAIVKWISVIKSVLGILAMLASIPLFFFGFGALVFSSGLSNAEPGFANFSALIGILVLVSCLVLPFVGWVIFKSAGSEDRSAPDTPKKRPLGEKLCSNCGCQSAQDSKTCVVCGNDVKLAERRCRCNRNVR